jgi:two-component system cell cycle sensor histidine kinase/response regulator CckA
MASVRNPAPVVLMKVLVIEDNPTDALLISSLLRESGGGLFAIECVERLAEGLDRLGDETIDAVLLDLSLPDSSGFDTLMQVEARAPKVPVVVLTGTDDEALAARAVRYGAQDYLVKGEMSGSLLVRSLRYARERKCAAEMLRDAEERYRDLVENARDVIYTLSLDGRFTSINKIGQKLLGYTESEALQMNIGDVVAPEQPDAVARILTLTSPCEPAPPHELEVLARDGRRIQLEVSSRVVHSGSAAVAIQGIARDVTGRKQLEEQLRLAQKMESIGTLAGGIAHDFNNIMTGIIGFADLGMLTIEPENPLYEILRDIKGFGERAGNLTRQLLQFARTQVLTRQHIDLNATIEEMGKLLRRVIGGRIVLRLSLADDLAPIRADVSQIEQVLVNLSINGRDAMPQGGALVIETANVTFRNVHGSRQIGAKPGKYVRMSLSDTGTGMDRATLERAFEPFFTTKERGQGTGLGLAIVYGIVQQHGGWIDVSSRPGFGTAFHVFLPAAPARTESASEVPVKDPAGGTETVLIVEDDDFVGSLIEAILRPLGYSLLRAGDGERALELFQTNAAAIDLVMTDVVLPKLDCSEVVSAIRRRKPEQKFLFVSGHNVSALNGKDLPEGSIDLISKPFTRIDLACRVREVLDR